jgi:gas vesicle protein
MKNSGSIFIGIIAAATAGVIIGMLIAPEKGEDLRKNIKDSAGDWSKKLGDLVADGKEQYKSLKSAFGEGVNDLKNEAKATKV